MTDYPRDMLGYAGNPPLPQWPNQARLALQIVLNYEEGAENNILHGDAGSETFLSEIINAESFNQRHMSMESLYEYGSRAGFWLSFHSLALLRLLVNQGANFDRLSSRYAGLRG